MSPRQPWRWKVADPSVTEALGLRYEPGNWGDILKAVWACTVLESLLGGLLKGDVGTDDRARDRRVFDPFAGRPSYPILPSTAERLERLDGTEWLESWGHLLDSAAFPSTTGLLQLQALERGLVLEATVFDVDSEALESWRGREHVRLVDARDGYEALKGPEAREADLVLVDPYDFFDSWSSARDTVFELARERPLLLYLYNKAARGGGYLRNYRALRRAFAESLLAAAPATAGLLGRAPADAILPRAYHEVLLLAPSDTVASVRETLTRRTRELATIIQGDGAVEDL